MNQTRRVIVNAVQRLDYDIEVSEVVNQNTIDVSLDLYKEYCELHDRYRHVIGELSKWVERQQEKVEALRKLSVQDILALDLREAAKRWRPGFEEELEAFLKKEEILSTAEPVEDCVREVRR